MSSCVVIGGGAAGAAAALAAREAGARVTVVRQALGATALSSGAVDLACDPAEEIDPRGGARSIQDCYDRLLRAEPGHPLSVARLDGLAAAAILDRLCQRLPLLTSRPPDAAPLVLPTDQGTFKTTSTCQVTAAAGDLGAMAGAAVGVVGIKDCPLFDAAALAPSYRDLAARRGVQITAAPVEVELLRMQGDELMHPHELAALVERRATLDRLRAQLQRAARRLDLSHLLLPPVLGLGRWEEVWTCLNTLDAVVAEVLASPPSVPGLRLQRCLDAEVARAGIGLVTGRVSGFCEEGSKISGLVLDQGEELSADAFVLASGKFIGRGLTHVDRIAESVFDLPVWIDRDGPGVRYPGKAISRQVTDPHPLMTAGIRVDQALRPLNPAGRAAWRNLFAAGSVIGGYDYILGRSGLGTALVTGTLAGNRAASDETGT